jgi:hypothetical protein
MAALVLAVGIGSVARFCPQDLRFESGKHPAKGTPTTIVPASTAPVVTPTAFATIAAPAPTVITTAVTTPAPKKKSARRSTTSAASSASASAAASATTALPENPYPQASPPETYGF